MEERVKSIAWSILSDIQGCVPSDSLYEARLLIDAIRLAALNRAICLYNGNLSDAINSDKPLFSALSYPSQRVGVSRNEVIELMRSFLERTKKESSIDVARMPVDLFVSLLGHIHSVGSFILPVSLQQTSSQRPLGAFYTPYEVADYIVKMTMGERLKECIQSCRKQGLDSLRNLLSLQIIDPACGTGVFLLSAFRQIHNAMTEMLDTIRKVSVSKRELAGLMNNAHVNLYGVDLDAGALEVADISLRLLESNSRESLGRSRLGITLKEGNSLISLTGFFGNSNNRHFFTNPDSRKPFEWQEQFPQVFAGEAKGFDFVVMNPPYERIKPNYAEFMREQLIKGKREVQMLAYADYKSNLQEAIRYFRDSREFKFATSYSINTYQLFIERALQLTREGGNIGCIVPSNILSDISAQSIRREILLRNRLISIDDFPEISRVFPGVTQSVCILVFSKGGRTDSFGMRLDSRSINDAAHKKRLRVNSERVQQIMGDSSIIPRIDADGLALLELMHKQPSLSSIDTISIKRGELDLTLNKNRISPYSTASRLIRGSNIGRFTLNLSRRSPEFVNLNDFIRDISMSDRAAHISLSRIACQQISNMGQRWRMKFAPVEANMVLANSCNYLVSLFSQPDNTLDILLGILNSELLNWRFQLSNSNNHISIRELGNLPIVPPDNIEPGIKDIMIREVQMLKERTISYSTLLEAYVFLLYGFGADAAQDILRMRRVSASESRDILHLLARIERKTFKMK